MVDFHTLLNCQESLVTSPLIASTVGSSALLTQGAPTLPPPPLVTARHFEAALDRVGPSVSRKDVKMYDAIRNRLRSGGPQQRVPEGGPKEAHDVAAEAEAVTECGFKALNSGGIASIFGSSLEHENDLGMEDQTAGTLLGGGLHGLGAGLLSGKGILSGRGVTGLSAGGKGDGKEAGGSDGTLGGHL